MSELPQNIRWSRLEVKTKGAEPITLADAKAFLNYADNGQDTLIQSLITAAVAYIEDTSRRPLRTWTCEGAASYLPANSVIILPYPKLDDVSEITYINENGVETTLPTTKYNWAKGGYFRIYEAPDDVSKDDLFEKWKVSWTCGSASIPEALLVATKMLVSGWFVARMAGDKDKYMDGAVKAILAPYASPPTRLGDDA